MSSSLKDTRNTLRRIVSQARGSRDQVRGLREKLAAKPDWADLTPEAQARRLTEARAAIVANLQPDRDRARQLAAECTGDAEERLGKARFFRDARFHADDAVEQLTRIRWALELPRIPPKVLGAMAADCQQRGGGDAAALLTLIRRELDGRPDAGLDVKTAVATAETRFPLPAELVEERELVAEVAGAADAIEEAWAEIQSQGLHRDDSDRVEHYRAGGAPPEVPTFEKVRKLPRLATGESAEPPNPAA